jgi:hypothetical protein
MNINPQRARSGYRRRQSVFLRQEDGSCMNVTELSLAGDLAQLGRILDLPYTAPAPAPRPRRRRFADGRAARTNTRRVTATFVVLDKNSLGVR